MRESFQNQHQEFLSKGLLRTRQATSFMSPGKICIQGRELLNFSSNDYLGLSQHPRVLNVLRRGLRTRGFGSTSSPLSSGYSEECALLESTFCAHFDFEAALVFPSGYQANVGVLSALLSRRSTALCDRFCHASLMDGLLLSQAKIKRFKHNEVMHAEHLLEATSPDILITQSVFSMGGDTAPLHTLQSLCRSYSLPFMVDDTHGLGILSPLGVRGIGITPDLLVFSFGKALGLSGAMVLGRGDMIDFILQRSRGYRYSTALSPLLCLGVLESFSILREETERFQKLKNLITFFNDQATRESLPLLSTEMTPIRSFLIGDPRKACEITDLLKEKGIYGLALRPPTVPFQNSGIRFSLTYAHTKSDITFLIQSLKEVLS